MTVAASASRCWWEVETAAVEPRFARAKREIQDEGESQAGERLRSAGGLVRSVAGICGEPAHVSSPDVVLLTSPGEKRQILGLAARCERSHVSAVTAHRGGGVAGQKRLTGVSATPAAVV